MKAISFNHARAEGALRPRRNASAKLPKPPPGFSEARRNFASAALENGVLAAFRHALAARKREERLAQATIGRRCGRHSASVNRTLRSRDWRLSTLSDFAEALNLRLEFSLVDLQQPGRRFTPAGVADAEGEPFEDKLA